MPHIDDDTFDQVRHPAAAASLGSGGGSSSSSSKCKAPPVISTSSAHTLPLSPHPCCCVSRACQVVDLAMWLETAKMDPELTGNVLGGGLLGDILHHMTVAEQAVQSNSKVPMTLQGTSRAISWLACLCSQHNTHTQTRRFCSMAVGTHLGCQFFIC
jgi:hypothetical protein